MGESKVEKNRLSYRDFPQFKRDQRGRMMVPVGWKAPNGFAGSVITSDRIQLDYPGAMTRAEELPKDNRKPSVRRKTLSSGG